MAMCFRWDASLSPRAMTDRKSLLRDYKARVVATGVYRVMNKATGHSLVAAHTDVNAILNRHLAQLRMSAHPNRALQADWNAHGQESFVFEVLDTLTPSDDPAYDAADDLAALEDMWLEKLSLTADALHTIRLRRPSR
jgi:hypothetical protein